MVGSVSRGTSNLTSNGIPYGKQTATCREKFLFFSDVILLSVVFCVLVVLFFFSVCDALVDYFVVWTMYFVSLYDLRRLPHFSPTLYFPNFSLVSISLGAFLVFRG